MAAKPYFDPSLISNFRDLINSSNVFSDVPEYQHYWNLICVLLDRLDSAVNYLNQHVEQPKNEEDFIFFLVYAAILKDGIYIFHENIYGVKPKTILNKRWFYDAHDYSKAIFDENTCPTDDVFFEYLRALAFAHPFGVDKRNRPFMENSEVHYSPWVISHSLFGPERDSVGLRIYYSNREDLKDIFVSFGNLKRYLLERYLLLKTFIKWGKEEIIKQNKKWKEKKVNRNNSPINILKNIQGILEERFIDHYTIDIALDFLNASFDLKINKDATLYVKEKILNEINDVCDCVDNLDYEGMEEKLTFLFARPKTIHKHAHYELEKIFDYLGDEKGTCLRGSNEEWGLIQAVNFYNAYAKKYVFIDFEKMNYSDIKLLVRASLIIGRDAETKKLKKS